MAEQSLEQALAEVIGGLLARADAEREKSESYKNLWDASENNLRSLLSEAHHQMMEPIMSVCKVIEEKFEVRISDKLYDLIKLLPVAMSELREHITEKEGHSCCADKTREIYYQEVLAEINRLKGV